MHRNRPLGLFLAMVVASVVALSGCVNTRRPRGPPCQQGQWEDPDNDFLRRSAEGIPERPQLTEKLLITDSIQHFDKAISLDPNFCACGMESALVSPTGKEFFDHLKKAVTLSDKLPTARGCLFLVPKPERTAMQPGKKDISRSSLPIIQMTSAGILISVVTISPARAA